MEFSILNCYIPTPPITKVLQYIWNLNCNFKMIFRLSWCTRRINLQKVWAKISRPQPTHWSLQSLILVISMTDPVIMITKYTSTHVIVITNFTSSRPTTVIKSQCVVFAGLYKRVCARQITSQMPRKIFWSYCMIILFY